MKNIDNIISESVDNFLLREAWYNPSTWFKKKVELTSVDYNDSGWYRGVSDGKELWIRLEPNEDWTKIESVHDEDGWEVKISNMPQGNALMYYATDENNGCYWGVDGQWNLKRFYRHENGTSFYTETDGEIDFLTHLYFMPEENNQEAEDNNSSEDYIPQSVEPNNDNRAVQNTSYREEEPTNGGEQQPQQQSNILNLDEDNPLSNAITRLIQNGQLRDTMTANYLTRYLFELDL